MSAETKTTTILVSNLHCSSCVRAIQQALSTLSPPPSAVNVSIISQTVTVEHSPSLSGDALHSRLDEAGFDTVDTGNDHIEGPSIRQRTLSGVSTLLSGKRRKHLQHCTLCQEIARLGSPTSQRNLLGSQLSLSENAGEDSRAHLEGPDHADQTITYDVASSLSGSIQVSEVTGPYLLTLSIGGMTCAACSNTVTDTVSQVLGTSNVVVSLLSNSATVQITHKDLAGQVTEAIEDCGFEAEVIKVESLSSSSSEVYSIGPRLVSLRVDGMFCEHCPAKIMASLEKLTPSVTIEKSLTDLKDPILQVSYDPAPPDMTIRHIVSAIEAADPQNFKVSIYRPPSLEQRARTIQLRERQSLLQRLIFSVVVAIPTFMIGVVYMSLLPNGNTGKQFLMEPMWNGNASRIQWALFFCATPVMFYGAGLFHRRSIKEIRALWRKGSTTPILSRFTKFGSMNLLVSSGVSVAYFSSIALLALSAAQPPSESGTGDSTTYFDSVVFLTMFLLCGRYLEAYSKARTADAITALGSLRPSDAFLITSRSSSEPLLAAAPSGDPEKGDPEKDNGNMVAQPGFSVQKVSVDFLEVGDVVRVQHGSTPPADGTIVAGTDCAFDESSLTGEARLIKKQIGDRVFLGTINQSKAVDIKVDAIGGVTMLDHIVDIVREGQTRRAPIERIADIITGSFVPVVTLLAIITWIVWLSLGFGGALPRGYLDISVGGWTVWSLEFAIAVFVVACPCGIGLAAPTALLVGSGLAAKHGILARGGGEAFQEMAQLDIVVFDKTGTLTEGGQPKVVDSMILEAASQRWSREVILGIASELESASSHPLGIAIRSFAQVNVAKEVAGVEFDEVAGRGVKARFEQLDCVAIIGNEAWMQEHGASLDADVARQLDQWKSEAKSVILLGATRPQGETYDIVAVFSVSDPLRPEAKGVISRFGDLNIGTWMISGDNVVTAKAVARSVGIPECNVIAGVLPHQKAEKIEWLQKNGAKRPPTRLQRLLHRGPMNERCIVAMTGDGINDAPALAAADVGIAIGSGSDVALSSASFILVSSNLTSLLTLSDLARTVFGRVKLNFMWAFMYNIIAVPIAAGVIYPAHNARLPPVWASLAMALSSVSVICSSLLLKLYKEPKIDVQSN